MRSTPPPIIRLAKALCISYRDKSLPSLDALTASPNPHMKARFILPVLVALGLCGCLNKINRTRAEAEMVALATALEAYKTQNSTFPTGSPSDIADALQGKGSGRIFFEFNPAMLNSAGQPIDPWGRPYVFFVHGSEIGIRSLGANGMMDSGPTSDDIVIHTRTGVGGGAPASR